jgi:uncharacterized protein YyaL (SSP411 family)
MAGSRAFGRTVTRDTRACSTTMLSSSPAFSIYSKPVPSLVGSRLPCACNNGSTTSSAIRRGDIFSPRRTGQDSYRKAAEKLLRAFARLLAEHPSSLPKMLCALDWYLDKPKEIVIVLPDYETEVSRFVRRLGDMFLPNRTLVVAGHGVHAKRIAELVPLAQGKEIVEDVTTAYVCENHVCKKPTSDPEEFARQLAPVAPYP